MRNKILAVLVLMVYASVGSAAMLTNFVWSSMTTSNHVRTNLLGLSNNLTINLVQTNTNSIHLLTNVPPVRTLWLGINTNVSVLRPGPLTNTLIFSNGILIHVASTNVP